MSKKKGAPVVIIRKDKRLFKAGHLAAFIATGGTSAVYTAAKAATNAGYNARTRKLQDEAETADAEAAETARADAKFARMVADVQAREAARKRALDEEAAQRYRAEAKAREAAADDQR